MPTYEYECQTCHQRVEAVQRFSDAPLSVCEACGGELRKVFSGVGIVFKGSGFYKTDSRGSSSAATPPASGAAPSSGATSPAATPTPAASSAASTD
jgi:putative FmdB family regulatory protein